eukprot:3015493-Ditylum_brightwellii.AAC.1
MYTSNTLILQSDQIPQEAKWSFRLKQLMHNFVAVLELCDAGCRVIFDPTEVQVCKEDRHQSKEMTNEATYNILPHHHVQPSQKGPAGSCKEEIPLRVARLHTDNNLQEYRCGKGHCKRTPQANKARNLINKAGGTRMCTRTRQSKD